MEFGTMKATVVGVNCDGEPFTENLVFAMIPPKEGECHYGTGYYMTVKTPFHTHLVDVRYERTTDVEILADRWMKGWYGANAHKITISF